MTNEDKIENLSSEKPELRMRIYLSKHYIKIANRYAEQSRRIEDNYGGGSQKDLNGDLRLQHLAYVIDSIISSIAFLEATINELFSDARVHEGSLSSLDEPTIYYISSLNNYDYNKTLLDKTLEKYQLILKLMKNSTFNKGVEPYQSVNLAIKLRNKLVHYEPQWVYINSSDRKNEYAQFDELKGKFIESMLVGSNAPFYPYRCLGYGCAEWTYNSVLKFTNEFFERINIEPIYKDVVTVK